MATGELSLDQISRAFRELVGAAEMDGWDGTQNEGVLNAGREACHQLGEAVKGMAVVANTAGSLLRERQFDDRELATMLAALRHWQQLHADGDELNVIPILPETDIASNGGTLKPLKVDEIDTLCDRLNRFAKVEVKGASDGL